MKCFCTSKYEVVASCLLSQNSSATLGSHLDACVFSNSGWYVLALCTSCTSYNGSFLAAFLAYTTVYRFCWPSQHRNMVLSSWERWSTSLDLQAAFKRRFEWKERGMSDVWWCVRADTTGAGGKEGSASKSLPGVFSRSLELPMILLLPVFTYSQTRKGEPEFTFSTTHRLLSRIGQLL